MHDLTLLDHQTTANHNPNPQTVAMCALLRIPIEATPQKGGHNWISPTVPPQMTKSLRRDRDGRMRRACTVSTEATLEQQSICQSNQAYLRKGEMEQCWIDQTR